MFKRLRSALVLLLMLLTPCKAHAQKVHALVVGDQSTSAGWGKYAVNIVWDTLRVNLMLWQHVPEQLLEQTMLTIEEDALSSPATILQMLHQLHPGPDDTCLFYFTGHGGSDDRGHYLALAGGKLYRDEVRAVMAQTNARLAVIITDCCNVRGDGKFFGAPNVQFDHPPDYTPLFRSLFIEPKGWVDINSCSPGEGAFFTPLKDDPTATHGSLFTVAFTDFVERYGQRDLTWDQLVRDVSVRVHLAFRAGYPNGVGPGKGLTRQTDQNVYALAFPGMPENSGPRTGITVRDDNRRGALIIQVRPGYPGAIVFDVGARHYTSLNPRQVITMVNGRGVQDAADFIAAVKDSPQVMRLKVRDGDQAREYLMRLRY